MMALEMLRTLQNFGPRASEVQDLLDKRLQSSVCGPPAFLQKQDIFK